MVKFTADELRRIMDYKHKIIGNTSVLAHVDHGNFSIPKRDLNVSDECCYSAENLKYCRQFIRGIGETVTGDKLVLRGLKFHGYHGVKPEERKLGQKFLIDVDAWMDLREAGNSDSLTDTISYTAIYSIVKDVVEGAPHNLLESVAQQIATAVLSKYTQVSAVRIQVGKPHVAVLGQVDYLGVEIVRHRSSTVTQS
ncbi:hypothetical protein CASFOL_032282 [Castilleja foliolosa]|uniref:7,8-dihydroneopterin aldolase n=1 Tax=Castilleja foliolosa TaxID=1961234 RepID=A0ABD3C125_9LAMI